MENVPIKIFQFLSVSLQQRMTVNLLTRSSHLHVKFKRKIFGLAPKSVEMSGNFRSLGMTNHCLLPDSEKGPCPSHIMRDVVVVVFCF